MTQTELGEYIMDIQNDIEDDIDNKKFTIYYQINMNGYGYTLTFRSIDGLMLPSKAVKLIIRRIEMIFESDFDLELIFGLVNNDHCQNWETFKQRTKIPITLLSIGKMQRRIKKFNRNI
jgi:hypothetical protein